MLPSSSFSLFFFNDTATTEIYTLSLHDALPISTPAGRPAAPSCSSPTLTARTCARTANSSSAHRTASKGAGARSEEHTSELQSLAYLVCRLLLEKKKRIIYADDN